MRTLILLLALCPVLAFAAEKAHTPKPGSKERTDVLNAIRDPLEDALKQPIIFRVTHLKVQDGWAFLIGTPRTKDDKPIDYTKTRYKWEAEEMDEILVALMRYKRGRWYVVTHGLFSTDVWWIGLDKNYKAPSAIFPKLPKDTE